MQSLTVRGVSGALSGSIEVIHDLAKEMLSSGYIVHVNALEVRLHHGPGRDTVVWHEGAFSGAPVHGAL